ncbi:MBL fold metallo-hydrolase [Halosquirtibacter xylanolyticus]|uniref:MBL fold metallo-hydrolase n=1 Tax=Halosquirtibacter xylanolyticus TaxID=3374599 RepID=UPI003749480D|nr:MBL fold metallo-hydrolase [Prolixibacteraceae bacterium]
MEILPIQLDLNIDERTETIYPVLIKCDGYNYLVDCGYSVTFKELKRKLEENGVYIKDLTGIVITHDDIDHIESLKHFKEENPNISILSSVDEKDSISGKEKSERLRQAEEGYAFLPDEHRDWATDFIQSLKSISRYDVDQTLEDNERLVEDLKVITTPGHTKGHLSLFDPVSQILISGDAVVLENQKIVVANPHYCLNLEDMIDSLRKIQDLSPKKVICYHGGVFEGDVNGALEELIKLYSK